MKHCLAHLLHWNHCEGLVDVEGKDFNQPLTWRFGVKCLGCDKKRWFD